MTNEQQLQRLLSALGLCAQARKLIVGTPMICEAMRGKSKPFLVVCAADNAENTQKKLSDKSAFYGVKMKVVDIDGETLATAIGKHAKVAAVAITDKNLCRLVETVISD